MVTSALAVLALPLLTLIQPAAQPPAAPRTLSFEERVQAQRAVEEVLHAHRIWPEVNPRPKPGLSSVLPDEILRSRVEDTLRKTEALHQLWGKEISVAQLQEEMERMAKESRDPAVLRELFAALHDDPFVIADTLARATLADRLIRDSYAVTAEERAQSFDSFWAERRATFAAVVPAFPADAFSLPVVAFDPCLQDRWSPMAAAPIAGRSGHTAVWTGAEMIVWGGNLLNTGARYTPATDTWIPTSTGSGVPAGRLAHTAVWTGTEMIVWGGGTAGSQPSGYYNTGGRYDPATDTWTPTSTGSGVPTGRVAHVAVWTGTEMIVWGGTTRAPGIVYLNSGGRYDPTSNQWQATSIGSGVPSPRSTLTAVWTGTEMIVWGGSAAAVVGDGGRYAPSSDSWIPIPADASSPAPRNSHTAVWAGSRMIVWGGSTGSLTNTGGQFDPVSQTWQPTSVTGAPTARRVHTAVWTGSEMVIWGGHTSPVQNVSCETTGGRYDPGTDAWRPTAEPSGVTGCYGHSAVWTGTEMIVWGGNVSSVTQVNTGRRYNFFADCDDGIACTVDSCDPDLGCIHAAHDTACNDGDPCTEDRCEPGTGCIFGPNCDDGNPCTVDQCTGQSCSHDERYCEDGEVCTEDSCDPQTGNCVHVPVDSSQFCASDPLDHCNRQACENGHCVGHQTSCPQSTDCVLWWCEYDIGCYPHTANGNACDDGNACTSGSTCHSSTCSGGTAVSCDDANACTNDSCDPATGCAHTARSTPEVGTLSVASQSGTVSWTAPQGALPGTLYDLVRGFTGELPVGSGAGESCLASGIQGTAWPDATLPSAGECFWYLVRARDGCGVSSYGRQGQYGAPAAERATHACPP